MVSDNPARDDAIGAAVVLTSLVASATLLRVAGVPRGIARVLKQFPRGCVNWRLLMLKLSLSNSLMLKSEVLLGSLSLQVSQESLAITAATTLNRRLAIPIDAAADG